MTKLYANISLGHENRTTVLESRVVAAAQCNADAIVINKSTPALMVPADKKYASVSSSWGNLPYIEVAKRCEISPQNAVHIAKLCKQIGITLIWCVTDSTAAEFVKEYCSASTVKLHTDAVNLYELSRFCKDNFAHVIFHHSHSSEYDVLYGKRRREFTVYHSSTQFPPSVDQLNLHICDRLIQQNHVVGYESRDAGVFPSVAVAYKGVDYIEKYLGDSDSNNSSILTPEQFYEYFKNLELLEIAHGQSQT
jgi:sialic acid synthase SpsE